MNRGIMPPTPPTHTYTPWAHTTFIFKYIIYMYIQTSFCCHFLSSILLKSINKMIWSEFSSEPKSSQSLLYLNTSNSNSILILYFFLLSIRSLIWSVSQSTPSFKPSPVTALLAQICHGLSRILSRPIKLEHLTLDTDSCKSILLAKNKIGIRRFFRSPCWSRRSSSSLATTVRNLSLLSMTKMIPWHSRK